MIAKGVSTVIAGLAIFFGLALSRPSQIIQSVNSNAELAAANAAQGTDATCGAVSAQQDYQTSQPQKEKYCADGISESSECNPAPTTNQGGSIGYIPSQSQFAAAAIPASCKLTRTNLCGTSCTYSMPDTGFKVSGLCAGPNLCKGVSYVNNNNQSCTLSNGVCTNGQGATAGNGQAAPNQSTAAAVSSDNKVPATGQTLNSSNPAPPATGAGENTGFNATAQNPTQQALAQGAAGAQANPSPAGTVQAAGLAAGTPPPMGQTIGSQNPAPPAPTFNANPMLNNIGTAQTGTGQSPFTPGSSYSSGYNGTGTYTPTQPTFGSGVPQTFSSPPVGRSPLTNFVSSIGTISLNSIVGFFSSVLAPASTPTQTQTSSTAAGNPVNQIIVETNPAVSASSQTSAQVSLDNPLESATPQVPLQAEDQNYQSLLDLLTAGQPATPSDIVTALVGPDNPTESIVTMDSSGNAQVEQQVPPAVALDSAINSQIPEATSLTLDTVNGLETSQPVSEQFYSEEASLAQAQSNYAWLQAQIAAWQNAENAGVCDNACENALSFLQNEVPKQSQQVQQLQTLVDEGPTPTPTDTTDSTNPNPTPAASQTPTLTTQAPEAEQANVVVNQTSPLQTSVPAEGAPFYTEQNNQWCDQYGQCIPQSSFESAPVLPSAGVTTALTVTNPTQPQNPAADDPIAAIAQTVGGWVNDVVSLFTPSTSSATGQTQSCSLFKSLFGGCNGY